MISAPGEERRAGMRLLLPSGVWPRVPSSPRRLPYDKHLEPDPSARVMPRTRACPRPPDSTARRSGSSQRQTHGMVSRDAWPTPPRAHEVGDHGAGTKAKASAPARPEGSSRGSRRGPRESRTRAMYAPCSRGYRRSCAGEALAGRRVLQLLRALPRHRPGDHRDAMERAGRPPAAGNPARPVVYARRSRTERGVGHRSRRDTATGRAPSRPRRRGECPQVLLGGRSRRKELLEPNRARRWVLSGASKRARVGEEPERRGPGPPRSRAGRPRRSHPRGATVAERPVPRGDRPQVGRSNTCESRGQDERGVHGPLLPVPARVATRVPCAQICRVRPLSQGWSGP